MSEKEHFTETTVRGCNYFRLTVLISEHDRGIETHKTAQNSTEDDRQ